MWKTVSQQLRGKLGGEVEMGRFSWKMVLEDGQMASVRSIVRTQGNQSNQITPFFFPEPILFWVVCSGNLRMQRDSIQERKGIQIFHIRSSYMLPRFVSVTRKEKKKSVYFSITVTKAFHRYHLPMITCILFASMQLCLVLVNVDMVPSEQLLAGVVLGPPSFCKRTQGKLWFLWLVHLKICSLDGRASGILK